MGMGKGRDRIFSLYRSGHHLATSNHVSFRKLIVSCISQTIYKRLIAIYSSNKVATLPF